MKVENQELETEIVEQVEASESSSPASGSDSAGSSDADNLLKTLEKEREERKKAESLAKQRDSRVRQLETELSKLKEIDPDKYWNMLKQQKEREEADLLKKQQFEELKARYQSDAQEAARREQEAYNRLNDLQIDTTIKEAFFSVGGKRPNVMSDVEGDLTPLESVMSIIKPRMAVKDGRVVILDNGGNPELNKDGQPKSVSEKMLELKRGTLGVFFQDDSTATGGGMRNSPTGTVNGKTVKMYTKEQVRQGKANIDEIASGKAIVVD